MLVLESLAFVEDSRNTVLSMGSPQRIMSYALGFLEKSHDEKYEDE